MSQTAELRWLPAMHASRPKHRPPTVWLKEAPNKNQPPLLSPSPVSEPAPVTSAARPASAQPLTNESPALAIRHVAEDPWQTYEAIIEIFQTERVFLARHRRNKAELVHVQRLEQSPSVAALRETMSQLSHPSFRTLLETYHHANHAFLVWEPVALSVSQVLASKCLVTESEILAIVRPVCGIVIDPGPSKLTCSRSSRESGICATGGECSPP